MRWLGSAGNISGQILDSLAGFLESRRGHEGGLQSDRSAGPACRKTLRTLPARKMAQANVRACRPRISALHR
jgi:hypothetical protein